MRLIDADALCDAMYHEAFENDASYNERNPMAKWDSGLWIRYKLFENTIADAPSIDIEHKRGEWIDKGWHGDWQYETDGRGNCWHLWECSVCNNTNMGKTKFCPNCGADMRAEQTEPNNCEPQTEYDKGLKLFADILFDKDKSNQFLEECKAIGIEPQTEREGE